MATAAAWLDMVGHVVVTDFSSFSPTVFGRRSLIAILNYISYKFQSNCRPLSDKFHTSFKVVVDPFPMGYSRDPQDHTIMRVLQATTVSGIPLVLGLRTRM